MGSEEALASWVRDEQQTLWRELYAAILQAADGRWSMRAADVARRIVEAARLVGPTPPDEVMWSLTGGGVYDALLDVGCVEHETLTLEWLRETERVMRDHGGSREELRTQFAPTVVAIFEPSEARYIRDDKG